MKALNAKLEIPKLNNQLTVGFMLAICLPILAGCSAVQTNKPFNSGIHDRPHQSAATRAGASKQIGATEKAAAIALRNGDLASAENAYQKLSTIRGGKIKGYEGLGRIHLRRGNLVSARRVFETALSHSPNSIEPSIGLGQVEILSHDYASASGRFEKLAKDHPGNLRVLIASGVALDGLRQHASAQARYRRVLELDIDNLAAINNLGLSLALDGKPDEAVELLGEAAKPTNAPPTIRQNLAIALAMKGEKKAAISIAELDIDNQQAKSNIKLVELATRKSIGG